MTRWLLLTLLSLVLCYDAAIPAHAELSWPQNLNAAQSEMRAYIEQVNLNLSEMHAQTVNSMFECYPTFAVLGVTGADNAEEAEGIELSFTLGADSMDRVELRVNEPGRFTAIAAAMIQAASAGLTLEDAQRGPLSYVQRIERDQANHTVQSFADAVMLDRGESTRVYYAYEYRQDDSAMTWLVMTIIFPRGGIGAALQVTPLPQATDENSRLSNDDGDEEWVGYQSDDDYSHLEIYVSPTPEAFVPER